MDLSIVLFVALALVLLFYTGSALFWIVEFGMLAVGDAADRSTFRWTLDDVQVRIATVDAEEVVQGTVDALPDVIEDVYVVAEEPIDVSGATVHIIPEEFSCTASYKGRALEWARRTVPCEREYVLYLDEDTLVNNFTGLPDADIVQFTELPLYTGSLLSYLCEVFRIGYQYEQRIFNRLRFPLYVWGGGLAIRHSLEQEITWDRPSITEDTAFVWVAVTSVGASFEIVDALFRNQAPPTLIELLKQRRRWMSGTREDATILPTTYRLLIQTRAVVWGFAPIIVTLAGGTAISPDTTAAIPFSRVLLFALFLFLHLITAVGASLYGFDAVRLVVAVALTYPIVVLNTIGALWGFVSPISQFSTTRKISPAELVDVHPGLGPESLATHSGTDELEVTRLPPSLRNLPGRR